MLRLRQMCKLVNDDEIDEVRWKLEHRPMKNYPAVLCALPPALSEVGKVLAVDNLFDGMVCCDHLDRVNVAGIMITSAPPGSAVNPIVRRRSLTVTRQRRLPRIPASASVRT